MAIHLQERDIALLKFLADSFLLLTREQIQQLGHKQALHFAELLARSCGCQQID